LEISIFGNLREEFLENVEKYISIIFIERKLNEIYFDENNRSLIEILKLLNSVAAKFYVEGYINNSINDRNYN